MATPRGRMLPKKDCQRIMYGRPLPIPDAEDVWRRRQKAMEVHVMSCGFEDAIKIVESAEWRAEHPYRAVSLDEFLAVMYPQGVGDAPATPNKRPQLALGL